MQKAGASFVRNILSSHSGHAAGHVFVIAEVGQAHDGSLGLAHSYIDAIAKSGADAVKFQTHIAAAESTIDEPWRIEFSPQDRTRYEYWQRMEFTPAQWKGLKEHAEAVGLIFMSSPFSVEAVDQLEDIGIELWKVASGEVANPVLLRRMSETKLPIILSTGMSTWVELDDAVEFLKREEVPFAILQCTSMYPTPPEKVGLNNLQLLQRRYECPVGLSDHSGTIYPGLIAASKGASILEFHVTFSRDMYGPDVSSSLTFDELTALIRGVRFVEKMDAMSTDKDEIATLLEPMRTTFGRSLVARRNLQSGTILSEDDLAVKKPGTGIAPIRIGEVVGRRLTRDVPKDHILQAADIQEL